MTAAYGRRVTRPCHSWARATTGDSAPQRPSAPERRLRNVTYHAIGHTTAQTTMQYGQSAPMR